MMFRRCAAWALAVAMSVGADRSVWADNFDLPPDIGGGETAASSADNVSSEESPPQALDRLSEEPQEPGAEEADVPSVKKTSRIPAPQSNFDLEFRMFGSQSQDDESTLSARASAHWYGRRAISDNLSAIFNLRTRTTFVEGTSFEFDQHVRLDVQELALSWTASPDLTVLGGRVNIRNGVALGFNPTDWFKADSLVISDSQDPGDRREERLGTVILGGTTTIENTLLQFGYRPRITGDRDSWVTDQDVVGLHLDRTNPSDAFYLKATPDLGTNLALTANVLVEDGRFGAGLELSAAVSDSLVLYGEAFVQQRKSLASEAFERRFAGEPFRAAIGADDDEYWPTQLAVGGTWSLLEQMVGARDVSVSLEYHFNEAGLTANQMDVLAGAVGPDLAFAGLVRGYAADQQEPLSRHQLFGRIAWNDFWDDADLAAIAYFVPSDGSSLVQLSLDIPLNDNVKFNARGYSVFGSQTSVYGANPIKRGVQVAVKYAF